MGGVGGGLWGKTEGIGGHLGVGDLGVELGHFGGCGNGGCGARIRGVGRGWGVGNGGVGCGVGVSVGY